MKAGETLALGGGALLVALYLRSQSAAQIAANNAANASGAGTYANGPLGALQNLLAGLTRPLAHTSGGGGGGGGGSNNGGGMNSGILSNLPNLFQAWSSGNSIFANQANGGLTSDPSLNNTYIQPVATPTLPTDIFAAGAANPTFDANGNLIPLGGSSSPVDLSGSSSSSSATDFSSGAGSSGFDPNAGGGGMSGDAGGGFTDGGYTS